MSTGLLRHAAARLTESSGHFQLLMDGKDFPSIAVRICKPELTLSSEATGDVILYLFKYPFMLQTGLPLTDLLHRLDLDPQMIDGTHRSGGEHQRKVQRRSLQVKLGVVRYLLLRLHPEYLFVERHRLGHITHIK